MVSIVVGTFMLTSCGAKMDVDDFIRADTMVETISIDELLEQLTFGRTAQLNVGFNTFYQDGKDTNWDERPNDLAIMLNGRFLTRSVDRDWELVWGHPDKIDDYWISEAGISQQIHLREGINELVVLALNRYGIVIDERIVNILSDQTTPEHERTLPLFLYASVSYSANEPRVAVVTMEFDKGNSDEMSLSMRSSLDLGGLVHEYLTPIEIEHETFEVTFEFPDGIDEMFISALFGNIWGNLRGSVSIRLTEDGPRIFRASNALTNFSNLNNVRSVEFPLSSPRTVPID